jgi:hypothetical protein
VSLENEISSPKGTTATRNRISNPLHEGLGMGNREEILGYLRNHRFGMVVSSYDRITWWKILQRGYIHISET